MSFKIYTKSGDKGKTTLIGGKRVEKTDIQVEAYGTIDELKSHIALLFDLFDDEKTKTDLQKIITNLFIAESLVASATKETAAKMPNLTDDDVVSLEKQIDAMDEQLEPLTAFVLPGGSLLNSHCNIARTVCRRTERICLRLWKEKPELHNETVAKYLNRLSDYLFTLSRYAMKITGKREIFWNTKS